MRHIIAPLCIILTLFAADARGQNASQARETVDGFYRQLCQLTNQYRGDIDKVNYICDYLMRYWSKDSREAVRTIMPPTFCNYVEYVESGKYKDNDKADLARFVMCCMSHSMSEVKYEIIGEGENVCIVGFSAMMIRDGGLATYYFHKVSLNKGSKITKIEEKKEREVWGFISNSQAGNNTAVNNTATQPGRNQTTQPNRQNGAKEKKGIRIWGRVELGRGNNFNHDILKVYGGVDETYAYASLGYELKVEKLPTVIRLSGRGLGNHRYYRSGDLRVTNSGQQPWRELVPEPRSQWYMQGSYAFDNVRGMGEWLNTDGLDVFSTSKQGGYDVTAGYLKGFGESHTLFHGMSIGICSRGYELVAEFKEDKNTDVRYTFKEIRHALQYCPFEFNFVTTDYFSRGLSLNPHVGVNCSLDLYGKLDDTKLKDMDDVVRYDISLNIGMRLWFARHVFLDFTDKIGLVDMYKDSGVKSNRLCFGVGFLFSDGFCKLD